MTPQEKEKLRKVTSLFEDYIIAIVRHAVHDNPQTADAVEVCRNDVETLVEEIANET